MPWRKLFPAIVTAPAGKFSSTLTLVVNFFIIVIVTVVLKRIKKGRPLHYKGTAFLK